MKKVINFIKNKLLGKHLVFRVQLFNILAMTGIIISFISAITCIINGEGLPPIIASAVTTLIALALLIYATRTGQYQRSYMITIVLIFMIFFPLIFLIGGGYTSAMPYYFVFAITFTVFMLEGAKALVIAGIELITYIGLCIYAFCNPDAIRKLPSEFAEFLDIVLGLSVVSIALSITMFLHFRLYNRQQKELEAARETAFAANEAKSQFLANMSHEIRTPIGIMLGMNEVILRETDSAQIKSYVQRVENAGQNLMTLINNILDVSAIEKGKLEITEERYETVELISSLSITGENLAQMQNLRFTTEADENLPGVLIGDMPHIRQIISNFLSNAAKYTEEGSITLSFSVLPARGEDEVMLQIAVTDTGIGINEENIAHIFDAFMRGDLQGRYIEGSGLGLAIAKEYAERMGGRVVVKSEVGRGSVFTLELVQKVGDTISMGDWRLTEGATHLDADRYSFFAPGCDILIVDDNHDNLQLIKTLLERTLIRIDTASSGEQCLELAARRRYDVILMDYMMPGMDGEETLRRLKETPDFDTPVIALTANVVAGIREKLMGVGFYQYISKPVRWRDLEVVLLGILPKNRVTVGAAVLTEQIPADTKEEFTHDLSVYGVELEEGLKYVDGDIVQYSKLATIFIENYETGIGIIRELELHHDWANIKFRVHSLKGNARNLGASALSETAAKIEKLCGDDDGAYITITLPTLYYEWERAKDGLTAFTKKLNALLPESEKETLPAPDMAELLQMLKLNQYQNALDTLTALIALCGESDMAEKLRDIYQKTYDLKFRDAERMLTKLMEGEDDQND